MIGLKDGDNVLDVGCGNGSVAISIAKKLNSFITGIDLDKNNIKFAKENKKNNLKNLNFIMAILMILKK